VLINNRDTYTQVSVSNSRPQRLTVAARPSRHCVVPHPTHTPLSRVTLLGGDWRIVVQLIGGARACPQECRNRFTTSTAARRDRGGSYEGLPIMCGPPGRVPQSQVQRPQGKGTQGPRPRLRRMRCPSASVGMDAQVRRLQGLRCCPPAGDLSSAQL